MALVISLAQGPVAAILTSLEFIIGIIAILSFRTTIAGIWLCLLHRRKQISLRLFQRPYYAIGIEAICFAIGAWLVLFVALIESRLQDSFDIIDEKASSKYCAFMNESYPEIGLNQAKTPSQFIIDRASIDIANQRKCPNGLLSLDFGTETDKFFAFAPDCRETDNSNITIPSEQTTTTLPIDPIDGNDGAYKFNRNNSYIIPYNLENYGISELVSADENDITVIPDIQECASNNISSVTFTAVSRWQLRYVNDFNVSRAILRQICQGQTLEILEVNLEEIGCDDFFDFGPECIRNKTNNQGNVEVYSTIINNSAVLISNLVEPRKNDPRYNLTTYACTDASIKIEYVFVSDNSYKELVDNTLKTKNQSVIIPTKFEVISGICEPTLNGLGLSALIYSAVAEWPNQPIEKFLKDLLKLSRQERFHAYMISLARLNYPIELLFDADGFSSSCSLSKVVQGTRIRTDASLIITIITLAICFILLLVSFFLKIFLPNHAWKMASFTQQLASFNQRSDEPPLKKLNDSFHSDIVFSPEDRKGDGNQGPEYKRNLLITAENGESTFGEHIVGELPESNKKKELFYRISSFNHNHNQQ